MTLHHGDCLEVMAGMDPESVDAIVTDPPYGLGFMGKHWDRGAPGVDFWAEMLRLAKPSAYLLAFGGTRTVHRIAVSIEDAGWIIRDMLVWAYASGFPKSKASLKPAWEPIIMARKPGPLRMLAIDECRIGTGEDVPAFDQLGRDGHGIYGDGLQGSRRTGETASQGRWPANVILTDPIFDGGVEGVVGGGDTASGLLKAGTPRNPNVARHAYGEFYGNQTEADTYGDSGTYSRFFLIPKADRADREPTVGRTVERANQHPTVKPTDLMRHLVRLVTPPGGIVLDPFLGSGTTAIAAEMEGFEWIGIEREAEYVAIAEARLNGVQKGLGLSA